MKTNIDFKRYIKNNPSQIREIDFYSDGTKAWYLNRKYHREDGPAVEYANGTKYWYLNGKLHREDGPAIEWSDGLKQWYLKGELYSEEFLFLKALEGKSILFRP